MLSSVTSSRKEVSRARDELRERSKLEAMSLSLTERFNGIMCKNYVGKFEAKVKSCLICMFKSSVFSVRGQPFRESIFSNLETRRSATVTLHQQSKTRERKGLRTR